MNIIKRILSAFSLLCWLSSLAPVLAYGTTAANFLKIGVGGRPVAMGEAYTALADGAVSAYWNPAGLAEQQNFEVLSMHADWFQDTSFQYLGLAFPRGGFGAWGLSFRTLSYGNIPAYNAVGSPEGNVSAYDSALCVSWGRAINERLSIGANLKTISEALASNNASTLSMDLGAKFSWSETLTFGLDVQNIFGTLKFIQAESYLPRKGCFGLSAAKFIFEPLTLTADYNVPQYENPYVNLGLEYDFSDFLAIRLGSANSRLQGGLGIGNPFFRLDYAYVPYEDLGVTHRVSFSFRFGVRKDEAVKKHYKLGKQYYRETRYLDALAEFKTVLEFDPLNTDSREYVDRIVAEMRQQTLTERVKSIREQKKKARELLDLAVIEFQKKEYGKAQKFVEQALQYDPQSKNALELQERINKMIKIEKSK